MESMVTAEQVAYMRELAEKGETYRVIQKHTFASIKTITFILDKLNRHSNEGAANLWNEKYSSLESYRQCLLEFESDKILRRIEKVNKFLNN
jgi:uncharacterized protein YerC